MISAGHYKSISNLMSNMPEGMIRESFSNAANLAVKGLWWQFSLLYHDEMENYFCIIQWWLTHPLLPKPYHTIQPVNEQSLTLTLSLEKLFSKVHCCFFCVISIPCMRLFSAICWWVFSSSVQGPLQKMDPMQLAPWFWGFVKNLSLIESERNYPLHYDAFGFSFAPKMIWHMY